MKIKFADIKKINMNKKNKIFDTVKMRYNVIKFTQFLSRWWKREKN